MATGNTTTAALADSIPTIIASARIVREYEGVVPQLVDKVTLGEGVGLTWNEVSMAKLTASSVTETTELDNAQQMSDTLFSITPTVVGIHTVITDRVATRISKNAYAKLGSLAQNAIQRKKDQDGITVLDGATTSLSGAGTTLVSGVIAAATARIKGNTTEPATSKVRAVLHPFQIKDLYDELVAGVGSAVVDDGPTATVFKDGFTLPVAGCEVYGDGNISIDSSDDAKGGVFAMEAIVLVQGKSLRTETRREPQLGGGATSLWIYDEYAYGERSAGNWLFECYSDATAPTS